MKRKRKAAMLVPTCPRCKDNFLILAINRMIYCGNCFAIWKLDDKGQVRFNGLYQPKEKDIRNIHKHRERP